VTFLFTDIEGSTRLWEEQPEAMRTALARHDALVRIAVEAHGGTVVKTTGDGAHAVFAAAADGVLTEDEISRIRTEAAARVERAVQFAKDSPRPDPAQVREYVFAGAS